MRNIGYVLKRFPRLSETFILQEILGLERMGIQLHVFALMDPREPIVHPDVRRVAAPIHYIHISRPADIAHMLRSHVALFYRAPRRYLGALKHVLETRQPGRTGLYLALKHFVEAGYLAELARLYGIDHLHAHFANNPTSLARFAQLLTGLSFSFTAHAKDIYTADPSRLADKIRYSEFTVTCTDYNRRHLASLFEDNDPREGAAKVNLVYHGVDTARFKPLRKPDAAGRSNSAALRCARLISIGRLVPKKGHADLIQAFGLLRQSGRDFNCEIYGTGPLRHELEDLISQLELGDRVSLCGAKTQAELIAVYQRADLFVLAPFVQENGDRDGLPNVLLEAMACGLPVVATNISGIPELITDGKNGLLVEPRDVAGLAAAIDRLLDDAPLQRRLAAAARRRVEEDFAADVNVRRLAALLGMHAEMPAQTLMTAAPATGWREVSEVER